MQAAKAAPSRLHSARPRPHRELKRERLRVDRLQRALPGTRERVERGRRRVVSTVQLRVAGTRSYAAPALARTWNVCAPSASGPSRFDALPSSALVPHAVYAAPSNEHSNVVPVPDEYVNVGPGVGRRSDGAGREGGVDLVDRRRRALWTSWSRWIRDPRGDVYCPSSSTYALLAGQAPNAWPSIEHDVAAIVSLAVTPNDTWRSTLVLNVGVLLGVPGAVVSLKVATAMMSLTVLSSEPEIWHVSVDWQPPQLAAARRVQLHPMNVDLFGCEAFAAGAERRVVRRRLVRVPIVYRPHDFTSPSCPTVEVQLSGPETVPGPVHEQRDPHLGRVGGGGQYGEPSRHARTATIRMTRRRDRARVRNSWRVAASSRTIGRD